MQVSVIVNHHQHNFRMKANTTNVYSLLILSLVIILSEACFTPPPPPPPSPTTTKAPETTKAPATTTAKPKDCPIDGKTCVSGDNVLELKTADGPDKCSKFYPYIFA